MKMNCERAEWNIFLDPLPFQRISRIHVEYHLSGGKTVGGLREALGGLGFQCEHLVETQSVGIG
jgi:hypothetical protein